MVTISFQQLAYINLVIKYYQLTWLRKLSTVKSLNAFQLFKAANLRYQLNW